MRYPKAKVLIVDDEPDILLMLRINLEAEGYETLLAGDGETAVQRIIDDKPDAVLLDVMMPLLDGWGVLEQVTGQAHPPVVLVVSAKSGEADRLRARSLGAEDYITKPFDPDDITKRVEVALRRSRDRQRRIEPVYAPTYNPALPDATAGS